MKFVLLGALAVLVALSAYWGIVLYMKEQTGRTLVRKAVPFQNLSPDYGKTLLILGDSTGVGVGADKPEDSVGGLLAKNMHATYTENRAVSGAVVADVAGQITGMKLAHYDTILLQIGGNDIVAFHNVNKVSVQLGNILDMLPKKGTRVLLMSAGNVGGATAVPPPLRPFYTWLNLRYHVAFAKTAAAHGATYINLYSPPAEDPFYANPGKYLAADGFHPSSAGYALWYERLKETVTP